jgi:hypothetical protein
MVPMAATVNDDDCRPMVTVCISVCPVVGMLEMNRDGVMEGEEGMMMDGSIGLSSSIYLEVRMVMRMVMTRMVAIMVVMIRVMMVVLFLVLLDK